MRKTQILGPDVHDMEYVSFVSDQDAYACTGQKCSAQSILFMHENWYAVPSSPLPIPSSHIRLTHLHHRSELQLVTDICMRCRAG